MKPEEIERESFRILLGEMHPHSFSETELPIVQRVVHATADFEFQDLIRFSPGAIDSAIRAIRSGRPVFSDVRMIEAGIGKPLMDRFGCRSRCLVSDENVAAIAARTGKTRSETAMRLLGRELAGAAVLIGNAPTALFEVLRLYREEGIRPAVVVGVPVGFVNAAESKAALCGTDLDYITVSGRKGGSTVAVAIFNALLRLANKKRDESERKESER